MTPIPLHRVATTLPFTRYLLESGIPLKRALRKAKLPVLAMENPDCFIPSHNYWNFIANVAEREGITDLGFLVGKCSGADAADPGMAQRLGKSKSLHHALDRFCTFASSEISQVVLWLEPADRGTYRFCYRTSFDADHPAFVHFQWYGLLAMVGAIRTCVGNRWQPGTIGLTTPVLPSKIIRTCFPETRFQTRQAVCFITLSNRLLGKQFSPDDDSTISSSGTQNIKPANDFINSLKQVLRSYLMDGAPGVDLAADISRLSIRSLQRQLADEELTYRELLSQVRFEAAIDLLKNTDNSITEIAHLLDYSDPSHFARAFRRMAGVSPGEYQKK